MLRKPITFALFSSLVLAIYLCRFAGVSLVVSRPMVRPDAIVSLASHEWERLPVAAALAARNPPALLLLTQPWIVTDANCHRCNERRSWLIELGVQPERIRLLAITATGTRGEAEAALRFAQTAHVRRLMIVTSPYHTRRALTTFRAVFLGTGTELGIVPANATSSAHPNNWWKTPYDRWYVRYELAANVFYMFRYRVLPWATE